MVQPEVVLHEEPLRARSALDLLGPLLEELGRQLDDELVLLLSWLLLLLVLLCALFGLTLPS